MRIVTVHPSHEIYQDFKDLGKGNDLITAKAMVVENKCDTFVKYLCVFFTAIVGFFLSLILYYCSFEIFKAYAERFAIETLQTETSQSTFKFVIIFLLSLCNMYILACCFLKKWDIFFEFNNEDGYSIVTDDDDLKSLIFFESAKKIANDELSILEKPSKKYTEKQNFEIHYV